MQKSHVAYNQRKYAPAVCARTRRSPACMRGIVSHRSTACMRDGLACTKPAGFFGFYPRRACMRSRPLSATLRYAAWYACDCNTWRRILVSPKNKLIKLHSADTIRDTESVSCLLALILINQILVIF